ncbi:GGDEF domain-containing protein [Thalassospira sp. MA62]|nr:GGDEF domain-containing protein [Thalassospira sp. MA62]
MHTYGHRHQHADEYAQAAIELMAELGVVPHPDNYLIFYTYFAGIRPDMNQTIDILRSNSREFDELQCKAIHDRFFGTAREREITDRITSDLRKQLTDVLTSVENLGIDSSKYGKALDHFCAYIQSKDVDNLEQSLNSLVGATRKMEGANSAFEGHLDQSSSEISRLRQDLARMRHEAMTDGLTGIANRKAFDIKLRQDAMRAMESGKPLSLLLLDIDHFKSFNDNHGHQAGDQVIRLLAESLDNNVSGQNTAARYGGEEFAIIMPNSGLGCAKQFANLVRHNIHTHKVVSKTSHEEIGSVTVSIGVATFRFGEPLTRFIERADQALYLAKSQGRNRVATERDIDNASDSSDTNTDAPSADNGERYA